MQPSLKVLTIIRAVSALLIVLVLLLGYFYMVGTGKEVDSNTIEKFFLLFVPYFLADGGSAVAYYNSTKPEQEQRE